MTTTMKPSTDWTEPLQEHRQRYVGPAVVVDAGPAGAEEPARAARMRVSIPGNPEAYEAELAVPAPAPLEPGRRVLVTLADDGKAYVTGILDQRLPGVGARAGGTASVVEDEAGERIEVRDEADELVFRYDPTTGSARLRVPRGGLSVAAPEGDLTLAAGGTVRLHGESVELAARSRVRLTVHDLAARALSSIRLGRRTTRISAERIETVADRLTERVGSAYRHVKELLQTRAGRVRTLVSGTWRARSKRADLKSEENFKVDGRRIHLG